YGVLLAAVVLLGSTVPGPFTRRTELESLAGGPRRAVWLAAATGAWFLLTIAALGAVALIYGMTLLGHIPVALRLALVLPLGFVGLAIAMGVGAIVAWLRHYWSVGRRVHFTLVAIAAFGVALFFLRWNLLGWRFG